MLKDEAVTIEQVRQIVREEVERAFKKTRRRGAPASSPPRARWTGRIRP